MSKKRKFNQQRNEEEEFGKKKNFMITEEHLMDKTHMEITNYLTFLPADALYPPYTISEQQAKVLRLILKELNYLLYVEFKSFWATLLYNPSLKICIHSCIQYMHRKWLNPYVSKAALPEEFNSDENYDRVKFDQTYEHTQGLMRVVLAIYYRILHFGEENMELSNLYSLQKEIVNKYILDFPRLLEIIEIYGYTNPEIVKKMVKIFTNLSPTLYADFKEEIIEPLVARMGKNLIAIKKTTDREQFGIEYNYKRNIPGELSPGEMELKKKLSLLMETVSFFQTLNNISDYFPPSWGEVPRFNQEIHHICENLFIELEQAYKIWNGHNQTQTLHTLMNKILSEIIDFFIEFFEKCDRLFCRKEENSNFKEAYMKCLDRVLEHYGKRQSLGKKVANSKRYVELYRQILKVYRLDEFMTRLYNQEQKNQTYGLNMQYLIDFKITVDEENIQLAGRAQPEDIPRPPEEELENTEADFESDREDIEQEKREIQIVERKNSQTLVDIDSAKSPARQQEVQLDKLEQLISKKNRQEDYYQKLHKNFRSKITIQYEDEYDDLVDYEKRPMFNDHDKQNSSNDGSGDEYDKEFEQMHLVKSESNPGRSRAAAAVPQQKYDRKNNPKFVPVKENQIKAISNAYKNHQKYDRNTKPSYSAKNETPSNTGRNQYDDEECLQQCKARIVTQQKREQPVEDEQTNHNGGGNRLGNGSRGRGGSHQNRNKGHQKQGNNQGKKKYVARD